MSGAGWMIAPALMGLALCCVLLLATRIWKKEVQRQPLAMPDLPAPLRLALPVAVLLQPLLRAVLSRAQLERTSRRLDSLGLLSSVAPLRWEALRAAHAVLVAAAATAMAGWSPWLLALCLPAGYGIGGLWLRRGRERQQRRIARELPAWLDLMTVCIEAGATLTAGLRLIVAQAPAGPLRDYFERVLREIRGGRPRAHAFVHVAEVFDVECLGTLAAALSHAESSGMGLGQVLRAQAHQRTAERFARAEKLAMQAPVKMLGPLILCIFPCTFIVIGVPIVVRLREAFAA